MTRRYVEQVTPRLIPGAAVPVSSGLTGFLGSRQAVAAPEVVEYVTVWSAERQAKKRFMRERGLSGRQFKRAKKNGQRIQREQSAG